MMNASKRAVTIAAVVASVFGVLMLGDGASRAQTASLENCVNTPGGALCTSAGIPSAYTGVPNAYAAAPYAAADPAGESAYASVPDTFNSLPGTVFVPGAVAHNGELIGRDPDANIRLMLMKDPEPMDEAGE